MSERMKIGPYEVVRLLGRGGMSEVHEAENPQLGSRHAVKLFTYAKDDADVRERFLAEGRLLAKLSHPRIVKVTDLGTVEGSGRPYFVMDLVLDENGRARSLADVEPGSVDEDVVGRWYDDVREGLAYVHGKGVVHRDLKLQNVLIGPDGHAVLTDFGISKIFGPAGGGQPIVDTVQTIVKMREGRSLVMGSLGYMAPEIEMGVDASPQSDWYALGVIVYRLLTGTWCDARTDVLGALETYDPVWREILPKLLHANPNGRECPSYAEAKRAWRERTDAEQEERWLREKARGRCARHVARWLGCAAAGLAVACAALVVRQGVERRQWRAESRLSGVGRSPYDFDEVFKIPAAAKAEAQLDAQGGLVTPSREELAAARIDLLVITHEIFAGLNAGNITVEKAIEDVERLHEGFDENAEAPFDRWPNDYMQIGDDETTRWLLEQGLNRLRELSER